MKLLQLTTLLLAVAVAATMAAQTISINRDNKTIAISTTDEATATADIAAITIGFEIYGPDAKTVSADGGKISHAILDIIHQLGIKDDAIESNNQGLEKNTEFDEKESKEQRAQRQYGFHQSWIVSVPPDLAAKVIHAAIVAGANKSGAIDWRLSDRKALQAKAAENALVKAHAVADHMSAGMHVKLGALIYASNESPNTKIYFPTKQYLHVNDAQISTSFSADQIQSLPLMQIELHPQTIREEATVYAVFSIE